MISPFRFLLCVVPAFFVMDASCPSPISFPPPTLPAPLFTGINVDGFVFQSSTGVRPSVHVQWKMPSGDSLGVKEFVLLQKLPGDSFFSVLARSIPGNISDYYENIDDFGYPNPLTYKTVLFRMFALDSIGRAGDTAARDSIVLAWPPKPVSPAQSDTIGPDSLVWSMWYVEGGYYSYSLLYSDSLGLVWNELRPIIPVYSSENDTVRFAAHIPDSLFPLNAGGYSWVMKVEIPSVNAQSMAVRRLYAR